jgi:ATP-citrate lyase beta-subunit
MSRVKITEYRAKRILLGDAYPGVSLPGKAPKKGSYVLKVDQGIKKRFKQGLVAVDISPSKFSGYLKAWGKKGFTHFLAEPYFPHEASEESYLSLERVRGGLRLLYAKDGGVDIEAHPEAVKRFLIADSDDLATVARESGLPEDFLRHLADIFEKNSFAFLEINPLVLRGKEAHLLDAAVLVDSAAAHLRPAWVEEDIVERKAKHPVEERVAALQKTTPASLKLNVLNPDGSVFLLLSGGGGSITIADTAALRGDADILGNYGEYSGGPTREETYLYAKEIISLMLASKAKRKALVIAGGVANFTDIKKTFAGIIDALAENAAALRKAGVRVFVRRGGPNEKAGLAAMRAFLEQEDLLGSLHGSEAPLTAAIEEALEYIHA